MTLRFCDSFDHYTSTADLALKYSSIVGTSPTIAANGRNGTSALNVANMGRGMFKVLDAQATFIVGFALDLITWPTTDNGIIALFDGATLHTDLRMTADGKLRVTRNGTSLGLGSTVLAEGSQHYIEFKCTINDTTGVAVVKIDEVTELNLTSQDTRNAGNSTADRVRILGGNSASGQARIDDLYICDAQGSVNNDFLGDVRVQALFPSGNGNSSQLTGSDGNSTDNYLLVDEAAPNSDTDYVSSGTAGQKDTYAFGDLTPTGGTVAGVQLVEYARKDDAGARSIVSVARLSGTETDGSVQTLSTSYAIYHDVRETKPGGGAWSISDVNSAEFGVKINA